MESYRRDLSNDMAEHRPILKNNQNTCNLRFNFTRKTVIAFPKTDVLFLLRYFEMEGASRLSTPGENTSDYLEG